MIEPRVEEILLMAKREVEKNQFTEILGAGLVLTGGSSLMEGSVELAERVFGMSVRQGIPMGVTGLVEAVTDPRLSTGVGLLLHFVRTEEDESALRRPIGIRISEGFKRLFASLA
jgi:cell division protein FtsA